MNSEQYRETILCTVNDSWLSRKLGRYSCWQVIKQLDSIISLHVQQTSSQLCY